METPKLLGLSHITNNSCHLLFSLKKVVPPKNIAQFKELCSIIKTFWVLCPFMRKKKRERETGGSNQAYSSSNS